MRPTLKWITALMTLMAVSGAAAQHNDYEIATGQPDENIYAVGVGISSLVKVQLLPETGINLHPMVTTGFLENFSLLNENAAQFALMKANWNRLAAGDSGLFNTVGKPMGIRAVASLWQEGDQSIQLVARKDLDEELVYRLTGLIFENLPFLTSIDRVMAQSSLDEALTGVVLPLHPGAQRYYEERSLVIATPRLGLQQSSPLQDAGSASKDEDEDPAGAKRYAIYFNFDEVEINAKGKMVLDQIAAFAEQLDDEIVWIAGNEKGNGRPVYNQEISHRRMSSVKAALEERGIQVREVSKEVFGRHSAWLQSGEEAFQVKHRRVEVLVEARWAQSAAKDEAEDPALSSPFGLTEDDDPSEPRSLPRHHPIAVEKKNNVAM